MGVEDISTTIEKVRKQLNSLISDDADYKEIYKVSVQLDELISKYYQIVLVK